MSNQITHIRKPDVNSSVEHITHVKGVNPNNEEFIITVSQAVSYLKQGYSFHVSVGGNTIAVTYQKSAAGNEYIKTKPDHTLKDNLLSLPQF